MQQKCKPIAALPLFNDGWVFFFFGWMLSALMERYERAGMNTEEIGNLIFESYSIGAFFSISAVGFISVLLTVLILQVFFNKTMEQIRDFVLLKRVFVPISEVGLSAGAIIVGASLGIAFNYSTLDNWSVQHAITKSTIMIATIIALISFSMFWLQRSILAVGKFENWLFNSLGVIHILITSYLIYLKDLNLFLAISTTSCIVLVVSYYYLVFKRRKKSTSENCELPS